jgi:hypothetical protein
MFDVVNTSAGVSVVDSDTGASFQILDYDGYEFTPTTDGLDEFVEYVNSQLERTDD